MTPHEARIAETAFHLTTLGDGAAMVCLTAAFHSKPLFPFVIQRRIPFRMTPAGRSERRLGLRRLSTGSR